MLALVVAVWAAGTLASQAQLVEGADSSRPYRGLFGGAATASSNRPQTLDINGALFGGYDDDIFARGNGPRSENARVSGEFIGAQAQVAYTHRFSRSALFANGSTALRWLPSREKVVPTFYAASVGYLATPGPRTTVGVRHSTAYRPYFSIAPFAGGATIGPSLGDPEQPLDDIDTSPVAPDDFTLSADRQALQHTGTIQVGRRLSPRSRLSVMGQYGLADFRAGLDDVSNVRWRAAGRYSYDLTQAVSLRLGYGYRTFRTRDGRTTTNHDIDVGLRYGQPFVFQHGRTQLTLSTGSTMLVRDRLDTNADTGRRLEFRAIGAARLTHTFRAPWQADLTYTRSVGFVDGLSDPFQGDLVMASLGGLLTRRLDLSASAGYMSGAIGFRRRNFNTGVGNVRMRAAISQSVAVFAQYFYYQYLFNDDVTTNLIVAPELERQGVRAGLTVWLPVIR